MVGRDVLIVSGLAVGIDAVVHRTTIDRKGRTAAVLGTPLNRSYLGQCQPSGRDCDKPPRHIAISGRIPHHSEELCNQEQDDGLISDTTIIVEAGDASGSLYHDWETPRLGHPLFMTKAAASDQGLGWPQEMIRYGAWLAEIVISSFKRLFGDSVRAVRWRYVVQEVALKVDLYNKLLQVKREVIAWCRESSCMQPLVYEGRVGATQLTSLLVKFKHLKVVFPIS